MAENSNPTAEELLKNLFHSIQGVLHSAGDIAMAGADQVRKGVFPRGTGLNGVYGVTVRADLGRPSVRVEPFGNVRADASGQPTVAEYSEPRTDITEEPEQYLIVAELPGIAAEDVKLETRGCALTFTGERGGRKYRKELTLPANADMMQILHACHDGLLEIRVAKTKSF